MRRFLLGFSLLLGTSACSLLLDTGSLQGKGGAGTGGSGPGTVGADAMAPPDAPSEGRKDLLLRYRLHPRGSRRLHGLHVRRERSQDVQRSHTEQRGTRHPRGRIRRNDSRRRRRRLPEPARGRQRFRDGRLAQERKRDRRSRSKVPGLPTKPRRRGAQRHRAGHVPSLRLEPGPHTVDRRSPQGAAPRRSRSHR